MPGLSVDGELDGQVTLLAYANQRYRTAHAGRQPGHDTAALVDDPGQVDAALLELLPKDLAAIHAAGFLVMPQAKQDRALRAVSLLKERFSGFHNADQLVLDIQRAASPDEAIDNLALERRVGPLGRVSGDNILVRHEHHRLQV